MPDSSRYSLHEIFYSSQVVHIPDVNFAGLFIGCLRLGTHQGKWSANPLGDVGEIAAVTFYNLMHVLAALFLEREPDLPLFRVSQESA